MYGTYMGQKPCIDEGHGMTQERDLYIQLDMADGEGLFSCSLWRGSAL